MPRVCILSSVHNALDNRVFYREAHSLHRAGYDVTLVAVHDQDEVRDGIQIVALPTVPRWKRPRLWLTLLRYALRTRADVYHFHDPELLLVTPWLRWRTGKPTIYDVHEVYGDFIRVKEHIPAPLRRPLAWTFERLEPLLARAHSALVFSDQETAAGFSAIRRPQAILYNFPSRSFVDEALAATRNVEDREPVILYLGGVERARGALLMLDAFQLVRREVPGARLLIVGHFAPPGLESEMQQHAAELGIEPNVALAGHVPFEAVGEFLGQAAVGWVPFQSVPKYRRNVATKLFEYMAYALPIVSSDLPTTRTFIDSGECGYLVTPTDPAAHAGAISRLLCNPQRALAMGRRGQELVVSEFNWDRMEEQLISLYEGLLR